MDTTKNKEYNALELVAESLDKFAAHFYKVLSGEQTGNFICSPIGVSTLLSMVLFGARDNTEKELRAGLHMSENDAVIKSGLKLLYEKLRSGRGFQLCLANKIFINEDYAMLSEFQAITETIFKSKSQSLDLNFENASKACEIINKWCSEKTNGLINSVVKEENFRPRPPGEIVVMYLVNAVYFKGKWDVHFPSVVTENKPFYIDEKTKKDVPMMWRTSHCNSGRLSQLNAEYIELPYEAYSSDTKVSMFVILPDKEEKLTKIESSLHEINFKELHDKKLYQRTVLQLPRFEIEVELDLKPILEQMGMKDMFIWAIANFEGVCTREDAFVSHVVQKVFIKVTEDGTEAAALTYMRLEGGGDGPPPKSKEFTVNRPFICSLVETNTGVQLFTGRVVDPSMTK